MIQGSELDNPVLTHLYLQMRCGMFTNDKGEVLIVHEEPLGGTVDWVEFDAQEQTFTLAFEDGRIQLLGLEVEPKAQRNLKLARRISLLHFRDKTIHAAKTVNFLYKD